MPAERNPHADDSLLSGPLIALTGVALRSPGWVVALAVGVALAAVAYTVCGLEFKTSRLDLLSPRSEYNQRWLAHLQEFGARDDAVVVVRAADPLVVRSAVDRLGGSLAGQSQYFESVFYRLDLPSLRSKGLHYLPEPEFEQLLQRISQASVLSSVGRGTFDLALALELLNRNLESVRPAEEDAWRQTEIQYETLAQWIGGGLQMGANQGAPAAEALTTPLTEGMDALRLPRYLTAEEGRTAFILLKLKDEAHGGLSQAVAIARLRHEIAEFQREKAGVWAGLTGMPVIEYDEMAASQFDMIWTSIASLIVVAALFSAAYGGLRHAALASLVLLLGMAYAFGAVTLVVGHLNILSSAFGVVLVGLGIDFSIHYVASYLDFRRKGVAVQQALLETARTIGPGVVTGAVTTSAAFFCAGFTEFTGVCELGIVAGWGVLLCLLATILVLPPLIVLFDREDGSRPIPQLVPVGRWLKPVSRSPRLVLALGVAVTLLCVFGLGGVKYDHNLLNLQPAHVESSGIERELFLRLDDSVWFAVSTCNSREELLARKARFDKLDVTAKTEEIVSLVPASSRRRQQEIAWAADELARLPPLPPTTKVSLTALLRELGHARELLSRNSTHESPTQQLLARVEAALRQIPTEMTEGLLSRGVEKMAGHMLAGLAQVRLSCDPTPPQQSDLPRELTDRFIGATNKHLLKIYAKGNVWDLDALSRFVSAVEAVDPQITGHPVQTFYASRQMQESYLQSGLYALGAVFVLLLFDFRNLRHALLAMVPLALGSLQLAGLIGWFEIPLNAANMIVMPLLLGIGVDDGVHLVHELRRIQGPFRLRNSTAVALLLTSTTTLASFGILILARHQGLRSLGQVLSLGVFLCLAVSLTVFPAILRLISLRRRHPQRGSRKAAASQSSSTLRPDNLVVESPLPISPAVEMPALALAEFEQADANQDREAFSPDSPSKIQRPEDSEDSENRPISERLLFPEPASGSELVWLQLDDEPADSVTQTPRRRPLPRRSEHAS
jgi:hopanoid biosynthesis associated RND transporter like protein HpnN